MFLCIFCSTDCGFGSQSPSRTFHGMEKFCPNCSKDSDGFSLCRMTVIKLELTFNFSQIVGQQQLLLIIFPSRHCANTTV